MFGIPALVAKFSSSVWFYLSILAVVGALVTGAYYKGVSEGSTSGYKQGYSEGQASKQNTITELTNKINTDAAAANKRITELEKMSASAVDSINVLSAELKKKRTEVVYKYLENNPQIANRIAFSLPTVDTLNLLLSVEVIIDSDGKVVSSPSDSDPTIKEGDKK